MTTLRISPQLSLPLDIVTQTFGYLAKRRAGKTYSAKRMAEEMAAAKVPFAVLDPMGAWWGLSSSADGEKPGIPVVILGGAHGHVPLEPTSGKIVADLIVDNPGYYVIDMESFESGAQHDVFCTAFLDRLYRRKATKRDPLHLFIDEADEVAPQKPYKGQERMLGATEAIVRRGGIRGIGTSLISQRAAVINKNVLTQLDALVVLQTTGPQDQAAIREWIKEYATPDATNALMNTLPGLDRGDAWFYHPGMDILKRIHVSSAKTFNSSATPEMGTAVVEPRRLAQVDLDAVRERMAASIEKAAQDDPALLRKRITELTRQLAAKPDAAPPEKVVEIQTVEVVPPGMGNDLQRWIKSMEQVMADTTNAYNEARAIYLRVESLADAKRVSPLRAEPKAVPARPERVKPHAFDLVPVQPSDGTERVVPDSIRAGARKMIEVLARHHPLQYTNAQWATLVGMKHTGGTWNAYRRLLLNLGYVDFDGDKLFSASAAGLAYAGVEPGNPMTAEEVREQWRSKLRAGARKMFDVLADIHPEGLPKERIAFATGMEMTGGTFNAYLQTLVRNGLAQNDGGIYRATDTAMGA